MICIAGVCISANYLVDHCDLIHPAAYLWYTQPCGIAVHAIDCSTSLTITITIPHPILFLVAQLVKIIPACFRRWHVLSAHRCNKLCCDFILRLASNA